MPATSVSRPNASSRKSPWWYDSARPAKVLRTGGIAVAGSSGGMLGADVGSERPSSSRARWRAGSISAWKSTFPRRSISASSLNVRNDSPESATNSGSKPKPRLTRTALPPPSNSTVNAQPDAPPIVGRSPSRATIQAAAPSGTGSPASTIGDGAPPEVV